MFNQLRIEELEEQIKKWRASYYAGKSTVSDPVYDAAELELKELDPDNALLKEVGADIQSSTFEKVTHEVLMLSLGKAYTIDEITNWVPEGIPLNGSGLAMYKMDGFAVSLKYELQGSDYILVQGATRGKGQHGEDVTENLKQVDDIPVSIPFTEVSGGRNKFEIRGEVYMKRSVFKDLELYKEYENCRNIAPGSVRQKDPRITKARKLNFFAYNVLGLEDGFGDKMSVRLDAIHEMNIPVVPHRTVNLSGAVANIQSIYDVFANNQDGNDFDTDGVVFCVDDCNMIEELGNTSHHPRGFIAWKFETEEGETVLENIELQVSRTGLINPVGIYTGIRLEGATLTNATLHNLSEIERLGIGIGDTILVTRRGGTIPKILEVVKSAGNKWVPPNVCPVCGVLTEEKVSEQGTKTLHCSNSSCPAVSITKILHFIKVMEIDDVAISMVTKLMEAGFVETAVDLFRITREQLLTLDKVQERTADRTLKNIGLARKRPLATFLASLGIKNLGNTVSRCVASEMATLSAVLAVTEPQLSAIEGIGGEIAKNVVEGLRKNRGLIDELTKEIEVVEKVSQDTSGLPLAGKSFLITGTLSKGRNDFKKLIVENGGEFKSSVSKTLDYLVVGDSPGGKLAKAKKAGVTIITEQQFNELLSR
jgi:DNA ligase (NAD+)